MAAGLLLDDEARLTLRDMFLEELAAIVAETDLDELRNLTSHAVAVLWTQDLARDTQRQPTLIERFTSLSASLECIARVHRSSASGHR